MSAHGFLMYAISARTAGAEVVKAPERDLRADVDALLAAVDERTRLVFLANPKQPDRQLRRAGKDGRAGAGLPPAMSCSGRCSLRGIHDRQRLKPAPTWSMTRCGNVRDAAHLLGRSTACPQLRLGWALLSGRESPNVLTGGRSRPPPLARWPASPRWRTSASSDASRAQQAISGCPGSAKAIPRPGHAAVHPSGRQTSCDRDDFERRRRTDGRAASERPRGARTVPQEPGIRST